MFARIFTKRRVMKVILFIFFTTVSTVLIYPQNKIQSSFSKTENAFNTVLEQSKSDSICDVIVEFREEPMFLSQKNSLQKITAEFYTERFIQFANAVSTDLSKRGFAKITADERHQFYKAFFGVNIKLPKSMIPIVEQLPYVKKVHENVFVEAALDKSVPQIRANEVWEKYNDRGEGIVVGIIDTGIDYLHPALGGGIGTSFRVVGGYDFVNNDNDPMDDNGHGTHVAGIVAADDANIKGVAPKAKLFACKVLGSGGGGTGANVLAAIELVVDPNKDGNMEDRVNVVNMSLGFRNGDPDDAMSTAVDNAVKLGVVFCVAAGNNGQEISVPEGYDTYYNKAFETISSPGTARLAITVGAIDSVNALAYFSSKGPVARTFDIKPDVVAPGLNIKSLKPGGQYTYMNGTSMASPMVAGVAALILSYNKNLTPSQVKSAIVNHAVDLGLPVTHQGSGRIDAIRAIEGMTLSEPVSLNYDVDDLSAATWTRIETLYVSNTKNIQQSYAASFSGTISGITLSASPQSFSLAPEATQMVRVTLNVNNSVVPLKNEDIIPYGGFVHFNGSGDTVHVPWSFIRASRMIVSFSESDPKFIGASAGYYITPFYARDYSKVRWLDSKTLEVIGAFIEPYDFIVDFPSSRRVVIKENVPFNGTGTISINAADALNTIVFNGVDNEGKPLGGNGKTFTELLVTLPLGFPYYLTIPSDGPSMKISSASLNCSFYPMEVHLDLTGTKRVVIPQFPSFKGIAGNVTIANPSGTFFKQSMVFTTPPDYPQAKLYADMISVDNSSGLDGYNTFMITADTVQIVDTKTAFDFYMMKPADIRFRTSVRFALNYSDLSNDFADYATQYFSIINDSLFNGFIPNVFTSSYRSPNNGTMTFGTSPVYIMNLSYNNSFGSSILFNPIFFGALNEERYADGAKGIYRIFNNAGQKLKEDKLNVARSVFPADPGKYRIEVESENYFVKNARGKITLTNDVNTALPVPDAPYITSFRLVNGKNITADNFAQNEPAQILFTSKIFSFLPQLPVPESTKVFYRQFRSAEWKPLSVINTFNDLDLEGSVFSASLAPATAVDSAAVDLRVRIVDQSGNITDQTLSPAFSVGNWIDHGATPVESDDEIPLNFALYQNYPNPFNPSTTIRYDVPVQDVVRLVVYDILGREVSIVENGVHAAGRYSSNFNAEKISSGVYFYRLTVGNRTALKKMIVVK